MKDKNQKWPPRTCEMPEINDLRDYRTLTHVLNVYFRRGGPQKIKAAALVRNYIRMIDHLIMEYKYAREALLNYVNTPTNVLGPLFVAIGHLETVVTSLKRAIRFLDRIKRDQQIPAIERNLSVLSNDTKYRVTSLRDAIQHLDEKLIKGELREGEEITLLAKSNGIELFSTEIKYTEIANWIRELDKVSSQLATYTEDTVKT